MILFIQFRTDQSGPHELRCFYDSLGIPYSEFLTLNLNNTKLKKEDVLNLAKKCDHIILGGLGESGYEEKDDEKKKQFLIMERKTKWILKELIKNKKSILGICMGHQFLISALGGKVETDEKQAEAGNIEVKLTEKGSKSLLFKDMKEKFQAISSHKSSATKIPKDINILAYSDKCHVLAFQYKDFPVYGIQFHPEMDMKDLKFRLSLYPEYLKYAKPLNEKIKIETKKILENFLNIEKSNTRNTIKYFL